MDARRWLRFIPFGIGLAAAGLLYGYWSYALYQDNSWLEIAIVTIIVTWFAVGLGILVKARLAGKLYGLYIRDFASKISFLFMLLGFAVPALFFVVMLLQPALSDCSGAETVCMDLSGLAYFVTIVADFVILELCSGIFALVASKTSRIRF